MISSFSPDGRSKAICKHPWLLISCLYLLSVALRFALALLFRHGPTISIDESLYINIAKSLAAGEGITYRSQPIPYMYLLYPLLLVPLYLLPFPVNFYRLIQLYNAFLICTSIFPVFLFAKDFTGSNKKSVLASVLTMLMPDLQLAGYLMAESIIWPLSLWLIFFSYRLFTADNRHLLYGTLTGLFTALLFWAKPGSLVIGLVLMIAALFLGKDQQKQYRRSSAFIGLIVFAVCVVFFYVLYTVVFRYKFSILGLYKKQITAINLTWIAAVLENTFLQLLLFAIACGGLFLILPYTHFRLYGYQQKLFILAFGAGIIICSLGVAAFVDLYMWNGSFTNPALHLRYMAMYIPVLLVFSLGYPGEGKKVPQCFLLSLIVMALLTIFPGASIGFVQEETTSIDSLALSAYVKSARVPFYMGVLVTVIIVSFLVYISIKVYRGKSIWSLRHPCIIFFALLLLVHNICGYLEGNLSVDSVAEDAMEMNAYTESSSQDILIITQQNYNEGHSHWLEVYLRKPLQQVTVDSLIKESLAETDGVYNPFIPTDQDPNVGNHLTPETDTFLFGATVADRVEFNSSVHLEESKNGWYTLAQVPAGQRLVDTALIGVNLFFLPEDAQAQLFVFNADRYTNDKLFLYLQAGVDKGNKTKLEIRNADFVQTIPLSDTFEVYEIPLMKGDTFITARGGEAVILSYWTE